MSSCRRAFIPKPRCFWRGEDGQICHARRHAARRIAPPYVKDSNTILLQNHGTVTFDKDLEGAYYKLEIVDAYARILILAKQIGNIRPLDSAEMKELLELKLKFGLEEPRLSDGGKGFHLLHRFPLPDRRRRRHQGPHGDRTAALLLPAQRRTAVESAWNRQSRR